MMRWFPWWRPPEPIFDAAGPRDAAALAALHAASFARGWSEGEFERLLIERNAVAHRARLKKNIIGFIISRIAGDEAEILSVAISAKARGRGVAGRLLQLHLGHLAARGVRTVFLEVEETNRPARRLYQRAGFQDVGRRERYYPTANGAGAAALIMRRDLG